MSSIKKMSGFLLFLLVSVTGCKKPESLQYLGLENFDIPTIGIGASVIKADARFYNPNNFNMRLKEAEVDISLNEKYLGHSKLDTLVKIPKNDTFFIPVKVNVDMKTLLTNSLMAVLSKEVDVKIEGRTKIGRGGFYFNFPIFYQGKQKLKLFK